MHLNFKQISKDTDLREALGLLLSSQEEELTVIDENGQPVGRLTLDLLRSQTQPASQGAVVAKATEN